MSALIFIYRGCQCYCVDEDYFRVRTQWVYSLLILNGFMIDQFKQGDMELIITAVMLQWRYLATT